MLAPNTAAAAGIMRKWTTTLHVLKCQGGLVGWRDEQNTKRMGF